MRKYYAKPTDLRITDANMVEADAVYLAPDVDALLSQVQVCANHALAADSPTARKQALQGLIDALQRS